MPLKELKQFRRVSITAKGEREITLQIPVSDLQKWDNIKGRWELYKGEYTLFIGGHSDDRQIKAVFRL